MIARAENPAQRKLLLLGSLLCNLSLLGYFKYGNFVLENFQAWSAVFGLHFQPLTSNVMLPIGISFYTFASLSYTVDVYRREIRSDWSFADYALFVSFFRTWSQGLSSGPAFYCRKSRSPRCRHPIKSVGDLPCSSSGFSPRSSWQIRYSGRGQMRFMHDLPIRVCSMHGSAYLVFPVKYFVTSMDIPCVQSAWRWPLDFIFPITFAIPMAHRAFRTFGVAGIFRFPLG